MNKKIIALCYVGSALLAVLLIGGMIWAFLNEAASDRKREAERVHRSNTICGGPPRAIRNHNASWSHGGWTEVTCKDGTKRVVG